MAAVVNPIGAVEDGDQRSGRRRGPSTTARTTLVATANPSSPLERWAWRARADSPTNVTTSVGSTVCRPRRWSWIGVRIGDQGRTRRRRQARVGTVARIANSAVRGGITGIFAEQGVVRRAQPVGHHSIAGLHPANPASQERSPHKSTTRSRFAGAPSRIAAGLASGSPCESKTAPRFSPALDAQRLPHRSSSERLGPRISSRPAPCAGETVHPCGGGGRAGGGAELRRKRSTGENLLAIPGSSRVNSGPGESIRTATSTSPRSMRIAMPWWRTRRPPA